MSEVPTVKIKVKPCDGNPEGSCIINKSDYNPDVHELVDGEKKDAGSEGDKGHGKTGKKSHAGSEK